MTNFLLLDLVTAERAEAASLALMRRGLVPRTFGHGHPLAYCLRVTVRDPDENERLIEAAREIAPTLPAIPHGDRPHDHAARHARGPASARAAASASPGAPARRTSRIALDLDGTGRADVATGIGFYDHLLGSLAHHGLFDLEVRATGDLHVDEHHTVEDVALVLGAAFAEALGDRAGIRRFGDSAVPDGRVASRRRSSTSAGGRTP